MDGREVKHVCSEGQRFDRLERSLEAINLTLTKLTDVLVNNATYDIRLSILEEFHKDVEARLRVLEKAYAKNLWIERIAWAALVGGVLAYLQLT